MAWSCLASGVFKSTWNEVESWRIPYHGMYSEGLMKPWRPQSAQFACTSMFESRDRPHSQDMNVQSSFLGPRASFGTRRRLNHRRSDSSSVSVIVIAVIAHFQVKRARNYISHKGLNICGTRLICNWTEASTHHFMTRVRPLKKCGRNQRNIMYGKLYKMIDEIFRGILKAH
jgi:hypothetical protein